MNSVFKEILLAVYSPLLINRPSREGQSKYQGTTIRTMAEELLLLSSAAGMVLVLVATLATMVQLWSVIPG